MSFRKWKRIIEEETDQEEIDENPFDEKFESLITISEIISISEKNSYSFATFKSSSCQKIGVNTSVFCQIEIFSQINIEIYMQQINARNFLIFRKIFKILLKF